MKGTKRTRGAAAFQNLPLDWDEVAFNLVWPIFQELHPNASIHLPIDRERLRREFQFPSKSTVSNIKLDGGMSRARFSVMARKVEQIREIDFLRAVNIRCKVPLTEEALLSSVPIHQTGRKTPVVEPLPKRRTGKLNEGPVSEMDRASGLQVYLSRKEVMADFEIMRVLDTCHGLDMIALSAAVVNNIFGLSLRAALHRPDFESRFVIFDPSSATAGHYDPFVLRVIEESPQAKRGQAEELLALARVNPQLQIRVIRDLPLMYNAWLARDVDGADYLAHFSMYMYEPLPGGPALRASAPNPLVQRIRKEFDFVWNSVAVPFESKRKSKARFR